MHWPPDFTKALAARSTLRGELGRGGMAVVYRAHDRQHDREVALKVLDRELVASVERERFAREIRLAARLTHPHILPLFESGEAAGRLYYTMPVMAGETLRARLRGGPLPVEQLLEKDAAARLASGAQVVRTLAGELVLAPRQEVPSVAVLPFANMSADPDNAYFADGITDDIIIALTRLPGLKVAARTSAFQLRGPDVSLASVGEMLGVRHVVQGSVRRAGSRVRVTAQLMSVAGGTQQWSGRWDRELDDIFAIQDEIAQGIVGELEVRLGARVSAAPLVPRATADLVAYELFLQGRENIRRRMPAVMRAGVEQFQQALARDPGFAQPWIGLAEAYAAMGTFGYQAMAQCRAAALHALEQARRLGAPATDVERYRIMVTLYVGTDWREAAPLVDEVLRTAPHDAFANTMAALYYGLLDDPARLAVAAARAVAGDPLSPWTFTVVGLAWWYVGDLERALAMNLRAGALAPDFTTALLFRPIYLSDLGRHAEAVACARRLVALSDRAPGALATLCASLWRAGAHDEARRVLDDVRALSQDTAIYLLVAELYLCDDDRLAELLERARVEEVSPITMGGFRQLLAYLDHPRLGPLVRQFPVFAHRRPHPAPGASPAQPG
jgi:serine/threonine-protein kinase